MMCAGMIIVTADIVPTDPTGEACDCCGDVPWLTACEIVLVCTGERLAYLCADCEEMVRENADETE